MSCCLSMYTHIGYITELDNPQGPDRTVTGPYTGRSSYRHDDTDVPQVAKCPPVQILRMRLKSTLDSKIYLIWLNTALRRLPTVLSHNLCGLAVNSVTQMWLCVKQYVLTEREHGKRTLLPLRTFCGGP